MDVYYYKSLFFFLQEGISSRQPQSCQQCSKTFADMKSLQIHIFIDHHSHSKGPLPNNRNISPDNTAVASPPTIPNNPQNPFPSFNVQHQSPSLNQSNHAQQNTSSTTNESNQRPHSRGGASSSNSSIASEADKMFSCDLCGLSGIQHRQAYKEVRLGGRAVESILLLKYMFLIR